MVALTGVLRPHHEPARNDAEAALRTRGIKLGSRAGLRELYAQPFDRAQTRMRHMLRRSWGCDNVAAAAVLTRVGAVHVGAGLSLLKNGSIFAGSPIWGRGPRPVLQK
jgi:hypothetical protein